MYQYRYNPGSKDFMVEDILQHVSIEISEEIQEYAIEHALKNSRYLFIENIGGKKIAYCTHCGHEFKVGKLKHNEYHECENCHSRCIVKNTRYQRKSLKDEACFLYYEKSEVDEEAIVASGFYVSRYYGGDYRKVQTFYERVSIYVFKPGSAEQLVKYYSWMNEREWRKTSSIYSFNINSLARLDYSISYSSVEKAVKNTQFQYSMWEEFVGYDLLKFFEIYTKHPLIESLVKVGLKSLVSCYLDNKNMMRCINWRGKTIYKMLKISKKDLKDIRAAEVFISPLYMKLYQMSTKENKRLTPAEVKGIEWIAKDAYGIEKLEYINKYCSLRKIQKYIAKQEKLKRSEYTNLLTTWRDYLKDCVELGMDLKSESVLFPADLIKSHQDTIVRVKHKVDKELKAKMRKRYKELSELCFEYKDLVIRPVKSTEELLNEGKELHHCVARYAENHANGKTSIFVVRKVNEVEKPYFTIEIVNNDIKQAHGLRNCSPDDKMRDFLEAFKAEKLKTKKIKLSA